MVVDGVKLLRVDKDEIHLRLTRDEVNALSNDGSIYDTHVGKANRAVFVDIEFDEGHYEARKHRARATSLPTGRSVSTTIGHTLSKT
jgi:hypothetical protein